MNISLVGFNGRSLTAALTILVAGLSCGGDSGSGPPIEPPPPEPVTLTAATSVTVDDATNQGNASDLIVSFDATRITGVKEYRVFIVEEAAVASLTLASASAAPPERYVVESPALGPHVVVPPSTLVTIGGQPIEPGRRYAVAVLAVHETAGEPGALSAPSETVELRTTTVKLTYLANAGVLLEGPEGKILIDAHFGNLQGWVAMEGTALGRLTEGLGDFIGVDLTLATHNHGDHLAPSVANAFMNRSPGTSIIVTEDVRSQFNQGARVLTPTPQLGEREVLTVGDITVEVLNLRHFNQFGMDFSTTPNYGYIVHLGGKKFFHVGDVDYAADNFAPFTLTDEGIDVIMLPTFNTLLSAENAAVIQSEIAPGEVLGFHMQSALLASQAASSSTLFGARPLTRSMEFIRY